MTARSAAALADDTRGVLHNVRNALTPVSTILSRGADIPDAADGAMLERAVAELALNHVDAGRRRQLAAFVLAGLAAEAQARAAARADLMAGRDALAQALAIIGASQDAGTAVCDVAALLRRGAAIAQRATGVAMTVVAGERLVMGSAVMLTQVIGNLLTNATDAGADAIVATVVDAGACVVVRIADTGEGFDPALAGDLLRDGVSTRAHRAGGLGLAWSARAVATMGGALTLTSDGPGRGATATLTLRAA